ncbi:MAG: T9SS type A sorting domain-containing protein [Candidatus Poribacteria bacterium]|nr:T9SS type A sorting domain-containing protein [Candidatus Poribacteria bacterium]
MKNISRLIPSFGIIILMLLVPSVGHTGTDDVSYSVLTNQRHSVLSLAFNPHNSNRLAIGRSDGTIQVWDTSTRTLQYTLDDHTDSILSLTFSPNGSTLASGSADNTVRLWDASTGRLRRTLTKHTDFVTSLAFSTDGGVLASGSVDGTIRLWNPDTGQQQNALTGYAVPVLSLAFSPTGKVLATGRSDTAIRLWNLSTGKLQYTLRGHTDLVLSLAFSADGSRLASGGADGTLRLWNTSTGLPRKTLTEHTDWVNSVAFGPATLASGSFDKTIYLWDADTGNLQHTLTAHTGSVESLAFSPDGSVLASGSADGSVLLWELTRTTPNLSFDVTGDGVVDIDDFYVVVAQFGLRSAPATTDANGDGYIDIDDVPSGPTSDAFDELPSSEFRHAEARFNADFNNDGTISTTVFVLTTHADLNDDGIVNFEDIKLIVARLQVDGVLTAPHLPHLTPDPVQQWLAEAAQIGVIDPNLLRGVAAQKPYLVDLTPIATTLLPNYPNPFNPETWIPYQLATSAAVTLTIHDIKGDIVHTLDLGEQRAGTYQNRNHAAYWDGRNTQGESVASGVYFYTLSAGDFTATRKMLIRK